MEPFVSNFRRITSCQDTRKHFRRKTTSVYVFNIPKRMIYIPIQCQFLAPAAEFSYLSYKRNRRATWQSHKGKIFPPAEGIHRAPEELLERLKELLISHEGEYETVEGLRNLMENEGDLSYIR
jgi:hypothetical protein